MFPTNKNFTQITAKNNLSQEKRYASSLHILEKFQLKSV